MNLAVVSLPGVDIKNIATALAANLDYPMLDLDAHLRDTLQDRDYAEEQFLLERTENIVTEAARARTNVPHVFALPSILGQSPQVLAKLKQEHDLRIIYIRVGWLASAQLSGMSAPRSHGLGPLRATFRAMAKERDEKLDSCSDVVIDGSGRTMEQVVNEICDLIATNFPDPIE
ncbi:MAG: hypothetical protein Q4G30_03640 [Actinomycetaceae bacterium]|nr:hypothetical protein [Actinomycetaceae bacterium]